MERQPATQAQSCRLLLPEPPCLLCVANRPQQTRQPLQVAAESGPPPHCRSPSWTGAAGTPCWACARCSGTPAQRGKGAAGTAKRFRIERGAAELCRGGGMCRVPPSSHAGLFDTRGTATRTSACSRLQRAAAAAGEVALLSSPTLFPLSSHPADPPRQWHGARCRARHPCPSSCASCPSSSHHLEGRRKAASMAGERVSST